MRNLLCCLVPVVSLIIFVSGCDSGLRTEYVEGIVTLDGNPLDGALVTFIPSGAEAKIASGATNAKGKYVLTTQEGGRPGRGTTQGDYKVTIAKRKPAEDDRNTASAAVEPQKSSNEPPSVREMAALDAQRRTRGLPPPYAYITPKKYNSVETSGFTATVVRGKNRFNFDMVNDGDSR
jgi:hypothetical protein